jgi:hypothetical protein
MNDDPEEMAIGARDKLILVWHLWSIDSANEPMKSLP